MLGSYYEASEMYEKALRLMWVNRKERQEFIAQLYNNMGICFKARGKKRQAQKLYEESYRIKSQVFGKDDIQTLETLLNIAALHDEQGCFTKAKLYYDEIIEALKLNKLQDTPLFAETLQNKAISFFNLANYPRALQSFNESLDAKKQIYGNVHVSVANTLQNMALVYHRQGQYKKSLALYEEAIKIYQKKLGSQHHMVKIIQENYNHTKKFAGK